MIYERVNFNADAVRRMTREEFVARHIGALWLDRKEDVRQQMLSQVYDIVHAPERRKRKKS